MYKISQAAIRAGVSVAVLRAWERRYGIVAPGRTAAGYRLYDETAIERVQAMRRLVDSGWAPSQAALRIEQAGLPAAAGDLGSAPPASMLSASTEDDPGTVFVDAAVRLDERRVELALDELFAAGSFERVLDDRLGLALRALGDAWAEGRLSVAGEHMASLAALRRVAAAFEAAGAPGPGRPVLVGLPPGCRHEIGALAFATAARRRGLPVVYLGPDVPHESWLEAIRSTRARAIVIGIPTAADRPAGIDVLSAAAAMDEAPFVATGGFGARDAALPAPAVRLPDGIAAAAAALAAALERPGA